MKFPRNVRMQRSHLDAAPFAGVLFCTLIFVLLSSLVYTPGVLIQLPVSNSPSRAVEGPRIRMAMDPKGNYYYQNQVRNEAKLIELLKAEAARQPDPSIVVLEVFAADTVTMEQLAHLKDIAESAGIHNILEATMPRVFDTPKKGKGATSP